MSLRRLLFHVHLYAGLTVGLVLALLGLSGSALVFGDELDRWLHPELRRVVPGGAPVPLAKVLEAVTESQEGRVPRHLRVPQAEDAPLEAWMDSHGSLKVYVDPYSGVVLGARAPRQSLVGSLRSLHVSLFSGRVGEGMVGVSGFALIILCLSGLVLWWPGRRNLSAGFALRRPLRWRRANYDVHRLGGVLALALLLLAGLTGAALVFPAPFERALQLVAGAPRPSGPPSPGVATGAPLPLDVLLAQADQAMPGARTTRIDLPASPNGALRVRKRFPQEPHPNGMSFVSVDPSSGVVLRADSALDAPWTARLMALRYPLHIGAVGGVATRLLAVLTGLFPVGLFLTGFFLWIARLRTRHDPRARLSPRLAPPSLANR